MQDFEGWYNERIPNLRYENEFLATGEQLCGEGGVGGEEYAERASWELLPL